jgi:hypothetical protein
MNAYRHPLFWPIASPSRRVPAVVAPVPRPFDFGFSPGHLLVPLPAAVLFLNRKQRAVLALIDSGELRWAFDIRSPSAGTRTVRILRDSLLEYTGLRPHELLYDSDELEFAAIVNAILPNRKVKRPRRLLASGAEPVLSGSEVAQCFSCTNNHVLNLVREGLLRVPGRRAPGEPLLILRASVIEFLRQRRMT